MRVSRTRFSKRRLKRKTEFPIVAVVQKKRKNPSTKSQSFSGLRKESAPEQKSLTFEKENKTSSFTSTNTGSKKRVDSSRPQKKSRATIDYKNVILLRNLITAEGKILPRRINKFTAKQQRSVQKAIKSARIMGLIPFINKSRPF